MTDQNKPKPAQWQKGMKSPNPKGRPKDGQSWSGIIREVTEMSPEQIVNMVGRDNDLGHAFGNMPRNVKIKYLVIARVVAALMFDPSPSLLNHLLEREDGKVPDKLDLNQSINVEGFAELLQKVYGNRDNPGE